MMILILTDILRRHDLSGWSKAAWTAFLMILPFLGALIYLIAHADGMAQRRARMCAASRRRSTTTSGRWPAAAARPPRWTSKADQLLDSGAIKQTEIDALKAKALA